MAAAKVVVVAAAAANTVSPFEVTFKAMTYNKCG